MIRLRRGLVIGLASTLVSLLGANPGRAGSTPVPIQLDCSSSGVMFSVPYIAKQLGYFSQQGLDVDIVDANGGGNAVAAVAGGSAQFTLVGYKNMSLAVLKGQDLKAISTGLRGFPQSVVIRPELLADAKLTAASSLKDRVALLRGRIIAVNEVGGSSGEFVKTLLQAEGIGPDQARLVNVGTMDGRLAALRAKRIDAFLDGSPAPELALQDHSGAALVTPARDMKNLLSAEYLIFAVRGDYLKSHPDVVRRFLLAEQQALNTIRTDPDKARDAAFAFLADQASADDIGYSKDIQQQAFASTLPNFPRTVLLDPAGLKQSRSFLHVSDKVSDAELTDSTIAQQIAQGH